MSRLLNKQIHLLKNDIQEMMDDNSDLLEKELKLSQLQTLTDELNKIMIQEDKDKRDKEYKKVCNVSDSMAYHRVKNKPDRDEILITIKDNREKAKDEFNRFKKIEMEYQKFDSIEIPAFLFFNKNVISSYGKCPYIKIEENTFENRKRWLSDQKDAGKIYYDLYDKVINETELNNLIENKNNLELYFDKKHNELLTESQQKLLSDALSYLDEYINCPIKTKKIKEKFKIVVNHFSILVHESECKLSDYFSSKLDFSIPVNLIPLKDGTNGTDRTKGSLNSSERKMFVGEYNSNVSDYINIKDSMVKSKKYITNVKANLKLELYEHLLESEKEVPKQLGNSIGKRWNQLLDEERLDRFKSFAVYFVEKYLIKSNLITDDQKEPILNTLAELLNNPESKLNIKWNSKAGIIDKIYNLKWEASTGFFLEVIDEPEKKSIKKTVSSKTILTKENEKVINEEVLRFILHNTSKKGTDVSADGGTDVSTDVGSDAVQNLKNIFIEHLKSKLKLKRITLSDKNLVFDKFDEMYDIIIHN
jgi:hypothetical protein